MVIPYPQASAMFTVVCGCSIASKFGVKNAPKSPLSWQEELRPPYFKTVPECKINKWTRCYNQCLFPKESIMDLLSIKGIQPSSGLLGFSSEIVSIPGPCIGKHGEKYTEVEKEPVFRLQTEDKKVILDKRSPVTLPFIPESLPTEVQEGLLALERTLQLGSVSLGAYTIWQVAKQIPKRFRFGVGSLFLCTAFGSSAAMAGQPAPWFEIDPVYYLGQERSQIHHDIYNQLLMQSEPWLLEKYTFLESVLPEVAWNSQQYLIAAYINYILREEYGQNRSGDNGEDGPEGRLKKIFEANERNGVNALLKTKIASVKKTVDDQCLAGEEGE